MSEITIFALALLAVPVFARFAKVTDRTEKVYHLIGLGGLFLLLGEATRVLSPKLGLIAAIMPVVDTATAIFGYAGILLGTVWVAIHHIMKVREV